MKKRLFSLALASVMALSLAGCGGSKEAATEAETKAETEQTAADTSVKAEDTTAQEETKSRERSRVRGCFRKRRRNIDSRI